LAGRRGRQRSGEEGHISVCRRDGDTGAAAFLEEGHCGAWRDAVLPGFIPESLFFLDPGEDRHSLGILQQLVDILLRGCCGWALSESAQVSIAQVSIRKQSLDLFILTLAGISAKCRVVDEGTIERRL